MPYIHEYINQQELSGAIKSTLKLTDSDGVLPEQFIPIILHKSEYSKEKLLDIANDMIEQCISEIQIIQSSPIEETPTIEETLVNSN